ncbi:MAG TPA: hypothetical protein VK539_09560 [Myxococcaceae bacterium]|nr:hypothetical protein [Myxococcaceae bacterium]
MQKPTDEEFTEPVVRVRVPFQMIVDVARETVIRTHELVTRLTRDTTHAPPKTDSQATPAESR